jgi:hypothetical protein
MRPGARHASLVLALCLLIISLTSAQGPTIESFTVSPIVVSQNVKTPVLFTAKLDSSALVDQAVFLVRTAGAGSPSTIIGKMHDDGLDGDAVARDRLFSIRTVVQEKATGNLSFAVSATFRRVGRVISSAIVLPVWPRLQNDTLGVAVNHPPTWQSRVGAGGAITISNVAVPGETSAQKWSSEAVFRIDREADVNPDELGIDQWFDGHFDSASRSEIQSRSRMTIDGRNALRIEVSEIGRTVHIYIPYGRDVVVVSFSRISPTFVPDYERMLATLHLDGAVSPAPFAIQADSAVAANPLDAVDTARAQLGDPYRWGREGPDAFDCSGLIRFAFLTANGISLPHSAEQQAARGTLVVGAPRRGDLLFYSLDSRTPGRISHVGIVEDSRTMIYAGGPPETGDVRTDDFTKLVWAQNLVTTRRMVHNVTVAKGGNGMGTVTSEPPGIDCGVSCSAVFAPGSITLRAVQNEGSEFAGWSGDCTDGGLNAVITRTLSTDVSCFALFQRSVSAGFQLEAWARWDPGVARLTSSPPGLDCRGFDRTLPAPRCAAILPAGEVTLTITRASSDGWEFPFIICRSVATGDLVGFNTNGLSVTFRLEERVFCDAGCAGPACHPGGL